MAVGDSVFVSVVVMVMSPFVNVGPEWKNPGMLSRLVLTMQASIAAVAKEELLFNASVGVSECTALGQEKQAEAFDWSDDVKPHEEVIVG